MNKQMRDLCEKVLDTVRKAGANNCRASLGKSRFVEIQYRDKKPEIIKQAQTIQLSLDLFVEGRYSSQNTSDLRKIPLREFITNAVAATKLLAEDPFRTLPDPKYYQGRANIDLKAVDAGYDKISPERKHEFTKASEEAARQKGGDKIVSVEAGFEDDMNEGVILTSNGFEGYRKSTSFTGSAFVAVRDDDDRRPSSYDYATCRMFTKLGNPETVGDNAARRALASLGARKIDTGAIPVIIENRNAPRIMQDLLAALGGRNIYQKRSFLADKKGQKIASDKLTLIDDPFVPEGLASQLFDGDGITTKKRTIFDAGVLNDFYIDWYYSRKLNCEPTTGSPANLIIPPGPRSVEQIMKDLGRGVLVTSFLGGNSNPTTGDFSVGIFGRFFDKGEIVHPVCEMNIADNHLKFWNKLAECANDPWPYDSSRTPALVFTDVVVSGT